MTGVEAISNGVPAFKPVEWKQRPRDARWSWARCSASCSSASRGWRPRCTSSRATAATVISQIAQAIYGTSAARSRPLRVHARPARCSSWCWRPTPASPTSPGWPASQAEDRFLPRQLTKRGHRLVFSNGIIALAVVAAILVVIFRGRGDPADPALRHRRVHQLHPLPGRHGQAAHQGQGAGLAGRPVRQRPRRRHHRASSPSSSGPSSSGAAPGSSWCSSRSSWSSSSA